MTMTMTTNKPIINNLAELHAERSALRSQIQEVELELKEHYIEIKEKINSVTRIFGMVGRVKNMIGLGKDENVLEGSEPRSYLNTAAKVALPLVAGGLILSRGKSMMLKALIGYGLGQATKYVVSKNVDEHLASVKNVFSGKQKRSEENGIF